MGTVKQLSNHDVLVSTSMNRENQAPIEVTYRIRHMSGECKVVDVIIEGISMVSTSRQEYGSLIKNKGIDHFLNIIMLK